MSGTLLFALILIFTIGAVIGAIVLFNNAKRLGKDSNAGLTCTIWAWIIIAIYSTFALAGIVYLCITSYIWVILLFIGLPVIIIVGLVLTLVYGIHFLVEGYKKGDNDKRKVAIGMTCLIINAVIILTVGVLLILFMSGAIPIRLM